MLKSSGCSCLTSGPIDVKIGLRMLLLRHVHSWKMKFDQSELLLNHHKLNVKIMCIQTQAITLESTEIISLFERTTTKFNKIGFEWCDRH